MTGRIAKEIQILNDLDKTGRINYREDAQRRLAQYADKYSPLNNRLADVLGIELLDDLSRFPEVQGKDTSKVAGFQVGGKIWLNPKAATEKTKLHELSHAAHKHYGVPAFLQFGERPMDFLDTLTKEVQAEGTAYGVGYKLGVPQDVLAMNSALSLRPMARDLGLSPKDINDAIDEDRESITKMVGNIIDDTVPVPAYAQKRKEAWATYLNLPIEQQEQVNSQARRANRIASLGEVMLPEFVQSVIDWTDYNNLSLDRQKKIISFAGRTPTIDTIASIRRDWRNRAR